jgi:hypothetical protein
LVSIPPGELAKLPAVHPIAAQWNRVKGLLAMRHNDMAAAQKSLRTAFEIYQAIYGTKHWRVVRAKQELLLTARK